MGVFDFINIVIKPAWFESASNQSQKTNAFLLMARCFFYLTTSLMDDPFVSFDPLSLLTDYANIRGLRPNSLRLSGKPYLYSRSIHRIFHKHDRDL